MLLAGQLGYMQADKHPAGVSGTSLTGAVGTVKASTQIGAVGAKKASDGCSRRRVRPAKE